MLHRIRAQAEFNLFLLFDRRTLPVTPSFSFNSLTEPGSCIGYSTDGSRVWVWIYVDEEPDAEILSYRHSGFLKALLRAPSGRMIFTAYEEVGHTDDPFQPDTFEPQQGETFEISPGDYLVGGFQLDVVRMLVDHLKKHSSPAERRFHRVVKGAIGCAVVGSMLALSGLFGVWAADALLGTCCLLIFFVVQVAWWPICFAAVHTQGYVHVNQLKSRFASDRPDALLILQRVENADPTAQYDAGRFGCDFPSPWHGRHAPVG